MDGLVANFEAFGLVVIWGLLIVGKFSFLSSGSKLVNFVFWVVIKFTVK